MTTLALDPGSVRCGYAIFDDDGHLTECGLLKPRRMRDRANARIEAMARDVDLLIKEHDPDPIVIEDTSGKVGGRHGGKGAGLAVYGKAVGYIWASCEAWGTADIHLIPENTWTRGKPKAKRQTEIALMYRKLYDPASDPGGDAADAIGLGLYWIEKGKATNEHL